MKKKNPLVSYYDPETKTAHQIPKRELGPGHMRVKMEIDGRVQSVWIKTPEQSPRRHKELSQISEEALPLIQNIFAGTYDQTIDQWRDGFLRDANPDNEVYLWVRMGQVFPKWADGKPLEYRKEVLGALLAATSHPSQEDATVTAQRSCKLVSKADAAEIVHQYYAL